MGPSGGQYAGEQRLNLFTCPGARTERLRVERLPTMGPAGPPSHLSLSKGGGERTSAEARTRGPHQRSCTVVLFWCRFTRRQCAPKRKPGELPAPGRATTTARHLLMPGEESERAEDLSVTKVRARRSLSFVAQDVDRAPMKRRSRRRGHAHALELERYFDYVVNLLCARPGTQFVMQGTRWWPARAHRRSRPCIRFSRAASCAERPSESTAFGAPLVLPGYSELSSVAITNSRHAFGLRCAQFRHKAPSSAFFYISFCHLSFSNTHAWVYSC